MRNLTQGQEQSAPNFVQRRHKLNSAELWQNFARHRWTKFRRETAKRVRMQRNMRNDCSNNTAAQLWRLKSPVLTVYRTSSNAKPNTSARRANANEPMKLRTDDCHLRLELELARIQAGLSAIGTRKPLKIENIQDATKNFGKRGGCETQPANQHRDARTHCDNPQYSKLGEVSVHLKLFLQRAARFRSATT